MALNPALPLQAAPPAGTPPSALPNLGDGADMSPGTERRLGNRIAQQLYQETDYVDDPVVGDFVNGIWDKLKDSARSRGELPPELDEAYAWEILLLRDRTINAFALPGGYFGLHLGLVGVVGSRDELASVMAHELSHVTQRHIARSIAKQGEIAPWILAGTILGILAAGRSPQGATAAILGSQAGAAQLQLNFSRDMEREADRIGFSVLSQAGYEPYGFVSMFEKLQQTSRFASDLSNFPYLRSHPLTTQRIADMQARIPATGAAAALPAQDLEQAMVAARARVLSNGDVEALRAWAPLVEPVNMASKPAVQRAGLLYGAAFAALKQRDFKAAQTDVSRLVPLTTQDAAALQLTHLLQAELALAQGDAASAWAALQKGGAATPTPTGRAMLFLAAQAQIQLGQATAASPNLQTWVALHPRDAQAWQWLAAAYRAEGREVAAVRAEAEVNIAQWDFEAAASRLRAAQDLVRRGAAGNDHIEASIVDTRARQVDVWLKERVLDRGQER